MNVEYRNGLKKAFDDLTDDQVKENVRVLLDDPEVDRITITRNRHDRRKEAALNRKRAKPQKGGEG